MRVRRVVFPFTAAKIGGGHGACFTLAACLQREHEVEVVIAAPAGSLVAQVAWDRGFTVWRLRETPSFRHGPLTEAALLPSRYSRLGNQLPGTIIHLNDLSSLQSWGPAARMRGLPIVYHNRAFNRPVLPNLMVMRLAHRIICISQQVERRLPSWLAERSVVIDNPIEAKSGIDRMALRRAFEDRYPVAQGATLVGFVGNFAHRKRPRFFLEMARGLLEHRPDAVFVIFGRQVDETQEALERHAAELGIAQRTIFAGFRLPIDDNIAVLDLLAMTAIEEPLGRILLDALMLGVPYVATDDAGHGETVKRFGGGLSVPRDASPEQFAQTVHQGLQLLTPAVVGAAHAKALETLSASRHTQRVLAVYSELLKDG